MTPRNITLFRRPMRIAGATATADSKDITKSLPYLICDIGTKILSAVALVVLGTAGWLLQTHTQELQEQAKRYEQQERRYLPMLRTLIELEVVLERSARSLRQIPSDDPRFVDIAYTAGVDLKVAAYSLFTPDGDPVVKVHTPAQSGVIGRDKLVPMPLKAAVLMYSQIMTSRKFIDELPTEGQATLDKSADAVRVRERTTQHVLYLNPDAVNAWRAWMLNTPIPVSRLKYPNLPYLLQDLRFATAAITHDALLQHPDLGDRYVAIRNDVLRSRPTDAAP